MKRDITIRGETPADYAVVEHLIRETFWNVYCPVSQSGKFTARGSQCVVR